MRRVNRMGRNLDTVKDMARAFDARDKRAFLEHVHEDVIWDIGAFVTGIGSYRGLDGVADWFDRVLALSEVGESLEIEEVEQRELPDGRILTLAKGAIQRELGPLEGEWAVVMDFRDDKVIALSHYLTREEALRDLGLER